MPQQTAQQVALTQAMLALAAASGGMQYSAALPSSTPTTNHIHGPTGLFSTPGMERNVFSAMSLPNEGLASRLPVFESNVDNPIRQLITGVADASGAEPVGTCDDPPTAGFIYACSTAFVFGRVSRQTQVFDVDRIFLESRGERFDLRLVGGLNPRSPLVPSGMPGIASNQLAMLQNEVAANLYTLAVAMTRKLNKIIYTGNPANNTANGGYKEFKGLDMILNTGYVDALDGVTACPALNSYVQNFADDITTDTDATIQAFINAYRYTQRRASLAGLAPLEQAFVMSEMLFYELTEFWPCAYATYRCGGEFTASDQRVVDGFRISDMRDEMRNGRFLLIDGKRVPVIIDDAIENTYVDNVDPTPDYFETDAYLVPLYVLGNIPATYLEARNYDTAAGLANMLAAGEPFTTSDGGRFLWVKKPSNNFCIQALVKVEPRLIVETPHLGARITNLRFVPSVELPGGYTTDHLYLNGGVQAR